MTRETTTCPSHRRARNVAVRPLVCYHPRGMRLPRRCCLEALMDSSAEPERTMAVGECEAVSAAEAARIQEALLGKTITAGSDEPAAATGGKEEFPSHVGRYRVRVPAGRGRIRQGLPGLRRATGAPGRGQGAAPPRWSPARRPPNPTSPKPVPPLASTTPTSCRSTTSEAAPTSLASSSRSLSRARRWPSRSSSMAVLHRGGAARDDGRRKPCTTLTCGASSTATSSPAISFSIQPAGRYVADFGLALRESNFGTGPTLRRARRRT